MKGFVGKLLHGRPVTAGPGARTVAAADADAPVRPSIGAVGIAVGLLVASVAVAAFAHATETSFVPRVPTVDALAGLALGAFFVDRLLTFVPPLGAAGKPAEQRTADIKYLRVGFGAVLGALFVILTDLGAVKALTMDDAAVSDKVERLIATLAIAFGVAGLARLLNGINPQPGSEAPDPTDPPVPPDPPAPATPGAPAAAAATTPKTAATKVIPTPTWEAYIFGLGCLAAAAVIALFASDDSPLDLLGSAPNRAEGVIGAGTPAVVVRFGVVLLLAAVVEQLVEKLVAPLVRAKENKALVTGGVAVVLGVLAAMLVHLFLLHNVGFFGANGPTTLTEAIDNSSDKAHWFDTFATGLIIAAGTKPLHDLSSRLSKAKPAAKTTGKKT